MRALSAASCVMLQPFFEEEQRDGEWSLVFLAAPSELRVQEDYGGTVVSEPRPR